MPLFKHKKRVELTLFPLQRLF